VDILEEPVLTWPPAITIKKHPRAKHIKLKASEHGLELVVPPRFNVKEIPAILETHRPWIEKQLKKMAVETCANPPFEPPLTLEFSGIEQQWKIQYVMMNYKKIKILTRPHQEIVLMGNINNKEACKEALLIWLKEIAKIYLIKLLTDISEEIHLPFSKAIIRNQSSRWGSCTAEKTISLNFKLLFLPAILTRHIIIHELCHTKQLNHSDRFWKLVAKFDTKWQTHRSMLRRAQQHIPSWVEK
jgi:predicted metal-dependent hydrolase